MGFSSKGRSGGGSRKEVKQYSCGKFFLEVFRLLLTQEIQVWVSAPRGQETFTSVSNIPLSMAAWHSGDQYRVTAELLELCWLLAAGTLARTLGK